GELLRFAAAAVEEPNLVFAAVSSGKKNEILTVGAPARVGGRDAFGGKRNGVSAFRGNHPKTLLVLVFLEHSRSNGVSDPLAIGTQLRLSNIADLEEVIDGDFSRRGGGRLGGRFLCVDVQAHNQSKGRECDGANNLHAHD